MEYMNYDKIVKMAGYVSAYTPYAFYFKQQAQMAKRDNYIEYGDFFNNCRKALEYNKSLMMNMVVKYAYDKEINLWKPENGYDTPEYANFLQWCNEEREQALDKYGREYFKEHISDLKDEEYMLNYGGYMVARLFSDVMSGINQAEQELTTPEPQPDAGQPQRLTIPDTVLQALQEKGFIENAAARPLKWIAYNKRAKGETLNKKSLLDLLCLLGYPDNIIKDRKLLNSLFIFPNNQKLTAQNYTYITDTTKEKKLKRPLISEYHTELESIINQTGKEK